VKDKALEKFDKHGRKSDCDKVTVPTVNPEIWDKLIHQAKRRDLQVSALENAVTKVGAILTCSGAKLWLHLRTRKTPMLPQNFWPSIQILLRYWVKVKRVCLSTVVIHTGLAWTRNIILARHNLWWNQPSPKQKSSFNLILCDQSTQTDANVCGEEVICLDEVGPSHELETTLDNSLQKDPYYVPL